MRTTKVSVDNNLVHEYDDICRKEIQGNQNGEKIVLVGQVENCTL